MRSKLQTTVNTEPAAIRVLYIDTATQAALDLAREMGAGRMDVMHVEDKGQARELLDSEEFDIALLGMDGYRSEEEGTADAIAEWSRMLPVVCLFSSRRPADALEVLAAGAANYIVSDQAGEGDGFARLVVTILEQAVAHRLALQAQRIASLEADEARERADLLLNEMKHRIANSLALVVSMAHMQAGSIENPETRGTMEAFADRVHSFAQVHKGLYDSVNVGTLALDTYLERLARELHRTYVDRRTVTRLRFESFPASVKVDQAISLGVILSEWVSNAAKFAYPGASYGEIRASLRRIDSERAMLVVEDDGIGIVDGKSPGPGLGSQIVGVLAHGLGGWFELKPRERGMVAALHFPLPEPRAGGAVVTDANTVNVNSIPLATSPNDA